VSIAAWLCEEGGFSYLANAHSGNSPDIFQKGEGVDNAR
jgi:hypothetical protein